MPRHQSKSEPKLGTPIDRQVRRLLREIGMDVSDDGLVSFNAFGKKCYPALAKIALKRPIYVS